MSRSQKPADETADPAVIAAIEAAADDESAPEAATEASTTADTAAAAPEAAPADGEAQEAAQAPEDSEDDSDEAKALRARVAELEAELAAAAEAGASKDAAIADAEERAAGPILGFADLFGDATKQVLLSSPAHVVEGTKLVPFEIPAALDIVGTDVLDDAQVYRIGTKSPRETHYTVAVTHDGAVTVAEAEA